MKSDDLGNSPIAYLKRRLLVIGLCCSFLLCLLVIGITNGLLNDVYGSLPFGVQMWVYHNSVAVLVVPLAMLLACCLGLYYITREIIGGSPRYLDERQQLLRDKAHLMAYRIVILCCVCIGIGLILHAAFPSSSPAVSPAVNLTVRSPMGLVISKSSQVIVVVGTHPQLPTKPIGIMTQRFVATSTSFDMMGPSLVYQDLLPQIGPNTVLWSYAMLFISLLLLISTLPRSVIAWRSFPGLPASID